MILTVPWRRCSRQIKESKGATPVLNGRPESNSTVAKTFSTPAKRKVRPLPPEQQKFFDKVYAAAKKNEAKTGIPAEITTAQAILESNWGKNVPTDINTKQSSNNLFGIKANGKQKYVQAWTHE